MIIKYIIANGQENPHTFPTYQDTFAKNGHTETYDANEATHCFIEVIDGVTEYDQEALSIIKERNIPIICWDMREHGTMQNKKWTPVEWLDAKVYFIRNTNKTETYPDNCFPIDWAYFEGCDYELTTKEELFSREYDCCLISVESPTRRNVINGLLKDGRLNVRFEFLDHTQRLQYQQWVNEHRKAKLYISCDGGGFSNERPQQLFSIAPMLQNKSDYTPCKPFTDLKNCIEINEHPTKRDIDKILKVVNDKDKLYDLYLNHYCHVKNFYSEEWIANYILKTINNYDSFPA